MNRIAILILVLIVAALATLLLYRTDKGATAGLKPAEVRRQPETALQQVDTLIQQARSGVTASEQARKMLTTIIDEGSDPENTLEARLRLVELEQALGNNEAIGDLLLDAVRSHPGSKETPRLLFDLGLLLAGPLDRPDEAREIFQRVVNLYPDYALAPEALIRLARIRRSIIPPPDQAGQVSDLLEFSRANPDHPLADEALLLDSYMADHQETDHE